MGSPPMRVCALEALSACDLPISGFALYLIQFIGKRSLTRGLGASLVINFLRFTFGGNFASCAAFLSAALVFIVSGVTFAGNFSGSGLGSA